ncbi:Pol polyprotein [Plakobranchus ocellatus]|uniref:Pol polyprotein n=1 Tax=Plakobranchus ocellatus TaxID=259542 RepID=A0AAV4BK49_9GAST|nr:Pol polyprotein [Plakobranchus ocellatus]
MDACQEDLATSLREKALPTLERVAKEADFFLKARNWKLCDQPCKVFQGNARPRMDSVRPLEPEKKFNGGQRAGEAKTSVADQRSCFKCKKTGHIARYCTAVDSTTKKAGAGVVVKTTQVNTAEVRKPAEDPTMKVTGDLQSEVENGMLKLASGKSIPVMTNCAALRDPEKTRSLGLPVLKGQIGGREVDVMRDTGCEGVVVRKQLVDASQLAESGIDLVGRINPPSEVGHKLILTLVDYASRFAEAVPLHKIDTESVAEALVNIYSRLGVPEEVLSDQGTQFISDCMKEVCRLLGIKQKTTTPYHPMCNGLVERFNATLKTCLRRLCSEQPRHGSGTGTSTLFCLLTERCHRSLRTLPHSSCCVSFGRRRSKNQM